MSGSADSRLMLFSAYIAPRTTTCCVFMESAPTGHWETGNMVLQARSLEEAPRRPANARLVPFVF